MRDFGGMISVRLEGGAEAAQRLLTRTRLFSLAESLGGVESLIGHPATMTHASIPAEIRAARGIDDGLVRLSVGIEDVDDLRDDLAGSLRLAEQVRDTPSQSPGRPIVRTRASGLSPAGCVPSNLDPSSGVGSTVLPPKAVTNP